MALTPEFLQGSIWFMLVAYIVALAFQLYVLYLNWKQSKVKDQMNELIAEVKSIRSLLESKNEKKKR